MPQLLLQSKPFQALHVHLLQQLLQLSYLQTVIESLLLLWVEFSGGVGELLVGEGVDLAGLLELLDVDGHALDIKISLQLFDVIQLIRATLRLVLGPPCFRSEELLLVEVEAFSLHGVLDLVDDPLPRQVDSRQPLDFPEVLVVLHDNIACMAHPNIVIVVPVEVNIHIEDVDVVHRLNVCRHLLHDSHAIGVRIGPLHPPLYLFLDLVVFEVLNVLPGRRELFLDLLRVLYIIDVVIIVQQRRIGHVLNRQDLLASEADAIMPALASLVL